VDSAHRELESGTSGSRLRVLLGLANTELASLSAFASFATGLSKMKGVISLRELKFN